MFGFGSKRKQKAVDKKVDEINQKNKTIELSSSFEENIMLFTKLFADDDTLITRRFNNSHNSAIQYCLFYCDGVVNSHIINENIVKPLMIAHINDKGSLFDTIHEQVIQINETQKTSKVDEIILAITYGDTLLLIDGEKQALILNTKAFTTRSVSEPSSEKVISGPREGFCEAMLTNLSLIRRKIRSNELKLKFRSMGVRTHTQTCICYIDSLVDKAILKELFRRLDKIEIDGIIDSNYITELIRDSRYSPFRTIGVTERPDVVAAKLLEGRIALFVDGTPVVLTLPYLCIENFQSNEDYYLNFYYSSFSRIIRVLAFLITISIPALYIAIGAFHHEMYPTTLLISIAANRHNVPLPVAVEMFIMLIIFDILKETGVRMPSNAGQALSIVGALVIGQAAVSAHLVAAPVIIVVGLTAITNLLVPKMDASVTLIQLSLLLTASVFGFFGLILTLSAVFIHLYNLRSFGVPYMTALQDMRFQNLKDIFIRAPW